MILKRYKQLDMDTMRQSRFISICLQLHDGGSGDSMTALA